MGRSAGLGGGPYEDFVDRQPAGAGDGESDDLGDVLGGDGQLPIQLFRALLGLGVGDVVGQLCRDGAWLDEVTRMSGCSS